MEKNPAAFCDWIGESHEETVEVISSSFPAQTLQADFVGRAGPGRLIHAEYLRETSRQAAVKMIAYRAQLMRRHPGCSIKQYALVLADGQLPTVDDPQVGFSLGMHTIYLRDCDPTELLKYPSLSGLAVLAQGDTETRTRALAAALREFEQQPEDQQDQLWEDTLTLASIRLDRPTIEQTIRQLQEEKKMTAESIAEFYRHSFMGEITFNQGRDEGREAGREEASVKLLTALLESRFGVSGMQTRIRTIAEHLARTTNDQDSILYVTEAGSLDDLDDWLRPDQASKA